MRIPFLLQFSLRSLLVAVAIASAIFGVLGSHIWRGRELSHARDTLRIHGGEFAQCIFAPSKEEESNSFVRWITSGREQYNERLIYSAKEPIPDAAKYLYTVKEVELIGDGCSLATLSKVAGLPNINSLILEGKAITDDHLLLLKSMPSLEHISITGGNVSDAGLSHLSTLPLVSFSIDNNNISDSSLKSFSNCTALCKLSIHNGRFEGNGLAELKRLQQISCLDLSESTISAFSISQIPELHSLETLVLDHASFTGTGYLPLRGLDGLIRVHAAHSNIDDNALMLFSLCPEINEMDLSNTDVRGCDFNRDLAYKDSLLILDLTGTKMTDATIINLECFSSIYDLNVGKTAISGEGFRSGKYFGNLRSLDVSSTRFDDKGASRIVGMNNLRRLNADGTLITDDGFRLLFQNPYLNNVSASDTSVAQTLRDLRRPVP